MKWTIADKLYADKQCADKACAADTDNTITEIVNGCRVTMKFRAQPNPDVKDIVLGILLDSFAERIRRESCFEATAQSRNEAID